MQLAYDYDLFSTIPRELQSKYRSQFSELGLSSMMSSQIALFRDERTAAALKSADQTVQQFFLDAGFGLNVYSSGAPAGRYLARDDIGRLERMAKLAALMMERADDLRVAHWGDFNFGDFMHYNAAAKPIDEVEVHAMLVAAHKKQRRRKRRAKLGLLCGIGLVAYSVSNLID